MTAEPLIANVLQDKDKEIQDWLNSEDIKGSLSLKGNSSGGKIGRYVDASGKIYDARHVDVVLKKSPDAPDGYIVITAYPVKQSAEDRRRN